MHLAVRAFFFVQPAYTYSTFLHAVNIAVLDIIPGDTAWFTVPTSMYFPLQTCVDVLEVAGNSCESLPLEGDALVSKVQMVPKRKYASGLMKIYQQWVGNILDRWSSSYVSTTLIDFLNLYTADGNHKKFCEHSSLCRWSKPNTENIANNMVEGYLPVSDITKNLTIAWLRTTGCIVW